MEKERLIVQNFGPISYLDIEILPLTIFVGTQGSGKSTVAKLLTICRDIRWWIQVLKEEDTMKPFIDFGINEYFRHDSSFSYMNGEFTISFDNGQFSIKPHASIVTDSIIKELEHIITLSSETLLDNTGLKDNPTDPHTQNLIKVNSRMGLYILAERNLVGNLSDSLASILLHQIPLSKPLLEYMSLFEKAQKAFSSYEIPFFGVKFVKKEGRDRIELINKEKQLPLSACSSGLQSALPMLMVIDYALKTRSFNNFVVEEPEQNLFPENQREILGFFAQRLSGNVENRFVLTTHSPYLLSCLNVLMLAYRLHHSEQVRNESEKIIDTSYVVNPDSVVVYFLNPDGEQYCRNLISERTGLVSENELDSISDTIGEEFNQLVKLYIKTLKK